MIVSHITILSITFGHLSIDRTKQFLPTSIDGCTNDTFSSELVKPMKSMMFSLMKEKPIEIESSHVSRDNLLPTPPDYSSFPENIFAITYMYYSLFGTLITVIVGIVVSLFTRSESDCYESKYVHPIALRVAKWFPGHEKLFTDVKAQSTENKTSSSKESMEQHFNEAFDNSENLPDVQAFHENETNNGKFKSNLVYKSEFIPVENYKKLSEE
jgi:solute carrier family 5 (sodium-coupled monocarboxylate transporter), member 8/12